MAAFLCMASVFFLGGGGGVAGFWARGYSSLPFFYPSWIFVVERPRSPLDPPSWDQDVVF